MGLSSGTLLHQTNYNGLSGIIKERGFKVLYSHEKIKYPTELDFEYAIPMISFSDIPFSELSSHLYLRNNYMLNSLIKTITFLR